MQELQNGINQKEEYLRSKRVYLSDLENQLNQITSSKFYKIWQNLNQIKKIPRRVFKLAIAVLYFLFSSLFFITSSILKLLISIFSKKIELKNMPGKIDGVSFIIPTWNKKDMVLTCVRLLDKYLAQEKTHIKKEIIIVENGSRDGTSKELKKLKTNTPLLLLNQKTNLGYAKAVNIGIKESKYNYVYLLNNDMEVQINFFTSLIDYAQELIDNNKPFFSIASQVFFYDKVRRREESGKTLIQPNIGGISVYHCTLQDVLNDNSYTLYPGGGSSLINKHYFNMIGGYNYKSYTPLYCEDLDLGFNAWKLGLPSYYCAKSHVVHYHRSSSKLLTMDPNYFMHKNWIVFCLKNFDSFSNIIRHIFFYPMQILKSNDCWKYAIDIFLNIKNIFISKIKLYKYKQTYSDKSIINFPFFETHL